MSVVIQNCSLQQQSELASSNTVSFDVRGLSSYDDLTMNFKPRLNWKNRLSICSENLLLVSICTVVAIGFFGPVIIYITNPAGSRAAIELKFSGNCIPQVSKENHACTEMPTSEQF